MKTLLIAIDPGASGAIASNNNGKITLIRFSLDGKDGHHRLEDALAHLKDYATTHNVGVRAILELVHSSPQMGVRSAFSFGESFGRCKGALRALKIPFELVRPQLWQKTYPVGTCQGAERKKKLYQIAKDMFPECAKSQDTADALLLLNYFEKQFK